MKTLRLKNQVTGQTITNHLPPYICQAEDIILDACDAGNISVSAKNEAVREIRYAFNFANVARDILAKAHASDPAAFAGLFGDSVTINEE